MSKYYEKAERLKRRFTISIWVLWAVNLMATFTLFVAYGLYYGTKSSCFSGGGGGGGGSGGTGGNGSGGVDVSHFDANILTHYRREAATGCLLISSTVAFGIATYGIYASKNICKRLRFYWRTALLSHLWFLVQAFTTLVPVQCLLAEGSTFDENLKSFRANDLIALAGYCTSLGAQLAITIFMILHSIFHQRLLRLTMDAIRNNSIEHLDNNGSTAENILVPLSTNTSYTIPGSLHRFDAGNGSIANADVGIRWRPEPSLNTEIITDFPPPPSDTKIVTKVNTETRRRSSMKPRLPVTNTLAQANNRFQTQSDDESPDKNFDNQVFCSPPPPTFV